MSDKRFNPLDHLTEEELRDAVSSPEGMDRVRPKLHAAHAAHLAESYGLPADTPVDEIFRQHHLRRCEAHGVSPDITPAELLVLDQRAFFAKRNAHSASSS